MRTLVKIFPHLEEAKLHQREQKPESTQELLQSSSLDFKPIIVPSIISKRLESWACKENDEPEITVEESMDADELDDFLWRCGLLMLWLW